MAIEVDPSAAATTLAQDVGDQLLGLAVDMAPILVPYVLAMAALEWALNKFGVGGQASLTPRQKSYRGSRSSSAFGGNGSGGRRGYNGDGMGAYNNR